MSDKLIQVKVANVTLRLPVYRDKKHTLELAEEVGALVASMEAEGGRIDSQAFALLAAYEFARRLKALEEQNAADHRELIKTLDGTATALQRLAEEYGDGD
jgi:cell division protein ZapA (FtsZ GTPase activity inhibitor)